MYTQASSVVINISFQFQYKRGVRQGCKLSPLLFSLFMADLESHMSQDKCKGIQVNNSVLRLLMFADDLVLFSDSSEGLKLSLSSLESYCRCWDMKTNPTKTKVLIFSNMRVLGHFNFTLDNIMLIEVVREYKYLGITITSTCSFNKAISLITNQAKKVLFALLSRIVRLNYPPPVILCHLFDALFLPVLEYGGEVRGWNNCNAIELIHRKFCKIALNLPSPATNLGVYSELGRMPLYIRRNFQMIKYWAKLANCSYSPLLYDCLVIQVHESLKWASYMRELFNQCGLPYLWTKVGVDNSIPIGNICRNGQVL